MDTIERARRDETALTEARMLLGGDWVDAESGETKPAESFFETLARLVGVVNKLIDAFRSEKLWVQSAPSPWIRRQTLTCAAPGRNHRVTKRCFQAG